MLKNKCGEEVINASQNVDLVTLPPCRCNLVQHIHHCNNQIAVCRRAGQLDPDITLFIEDHGWVLSNGLMETLGTEEEEKLILQQAVIDTLQNDFDEADSDEEEEGFDRGDKEDSLDSCSSDED
jgi:hypothetical protein